MDKLLTIVVVTYNQYVHHLPIFLHSCVLNSWVSKAKILVMHDGSVGGASREDETTRVSAWCTQELVEKFRDLHGLDVSFYASQDRINDYGHSNRAKALELVDTKYLNWNNGDNYLTPFFVEAFVGTMETHGLDFCYSNILHNYPNVNGDGKGPYNVLVSYPHLNRIDISNFVVRTELAKKVGFNHRGTGADGLFVTELQQWFPDSKLAKIETIPLVHN